MPEYELTAWFASYAPANTPPKVVASMRGDPPHRILLIACCKALQPTFTALDAVCTIHIAYAHHSSVITSTAAGLPAPLASYQAAWNAAGSHWDCDALAHCFTEDALFFGGRPEHSVGREAIKAYFRSYIGTIVSCTLKLRDQHILDLAPPSFVSQGYGEFSFVLADGLHTRSVVRTTLILVQQGDGWKARLQHFGPPPTEPPLGRNA